MQLEILHARRITSGEQLGSLGSGPMILRQFNFLHGSEAVGHQPSLLDLPSARDLQAGRKVAAVQAAQDLAGRRC